MKSKEEEPISQSGVWVRLTEADVVEDDLNPFDLFSAKNVLADQIRWVRGRILRRREGPGALLVTEEGGVAARSFKTDQSNK